MAGLFLPQKWSRQPPAGAALSGAPIWNRACAIVLPTQYGTRTYAPLGGKFDTYGAASASGIGPMAAAGGVGIGPTGSLTTSSWRLNAAGNATDTIWERPTTQATWLAFVERFGAPTATLAPIFGNESPSVPPHSAWLICETSSSRVQVECSAGNLNRNLILGADFTSSPGPYVLVGRYNGAALSGALNGVFSTGSAISGSLVYPNDAARGPAIGNYYNYTGAVRQFNGRVLLAALWDVALSDDEIRELTNQLRSQRYEAFAPLERGIWVGAASSGNTGTVNYTNANDTSSASGTTTVTGSLAKTNANDTSSASGTTTVVGTSSTTNANDTISASGTTTVTGSLATTNANDTVSASGSAGSNTGTVNYTNANDTVSASGWAGTVTGTVSYSNLDDSVSARGETPRARRGAAKPLRKGYIIRGKKYWLTDDELAIMVALELETIKRSDIKVPTKGRIKPIPTATFEMVRAVAKKLDELASIGLDDDEDEEEELLLML